MDTSIYFELETPNTNPSRDETLLLYGLGEELLLTKKFVKDFTRLSNQKIRIETENCGDADRALIRILNSLRLSKNYMAHICSVTIV